METTKITWHSKYNNRIHWATKSKRGNRITANIVNNGNHYKLTFFDKNVVKIGDIEKFYNLELAKLYAECFIAGYFTY